MEEKNIVPDYELIECRQSSINARTFSANTCDFEIDLATPAIMQPGDSLKVGSVFLDTPGDNGGLIDLEANDPANPGVCNISMDFGYYLYDLPTTNESIYRGDDASGGGVNLPPVIASKDYTPARTDASEFDGDLYVACSKDVAADVNQTTTITAFNIVFDEKAVRDPDKYLPLAWFDFTVTFRHLDGQSTSTYEYRLEYPKGQTRTNELVMSFFKGNTLRLDNAFIQGLAAGVAREKLSYNPLKISTALPFTCLNRPGQNDIVIAGADQNVYNSAVLNLNSPDFLILENNLNGTKFQPIIETVSMSLPAGKYGAVELGQLIGRQFSKVDLSGDINAQPSNVINNKLLKSSRQMREELNALGKNDEVHFVRARDGGSIFQLKTKRAAPFADDSEEANYFVGTNEFGLVYDESMNMMHIDLMHMPLLDVSRRDQGGLAETRIYRNSLGAEFSGKAYSGIYIKNLTPNTLWSKSFKFDLDRTMATFREAAVNFGGVVGTALVPIFDVSDGKDNRLIPGINITSELDGIDMAVIKKRTGASGGPPQTAANTQTFELVPTLNTATVNYTDYLAATTTGHMSIFASGTIANDGYEGAGDGASQGYYQIEVDVGGVKTNFRGKDRSNNKVMSIISKYYSSTNYLSSYDEGSTEYFHKGKEPLTITKARIRVLDPDGSVSLMNQDNTVFLKISKTK